MSRGIARCGAALALLGMFFSLATAQDGKDAAKKAAPDAPAPPPPVGEEYRQFFKKPQNVLEFWSALQFEIEVGRLDLAGAQLHGLMSLKPGRDDLYKLGDSVGMAAILRLRNIRPWVPVPRFDGKPYLDELARLEKAREDAERIAKIKVEYEKRKKEYEDAVAFNDQAYKDVDDLVRGVSQAIRRTLDQPARIKKFVHNLTVGPEEKAYALKELYRSGSAVVPFLLEEWRGADASGRAHILDAMRRLGPELLPGLAAALDSDDRTLKLDLIDVFQERAAEEMVPHLWFLSAADGQPEDVRQRAKEAIALLLDTPVSNLPPAKVALTQEANRYYRHEVPFDDPKAVAVWRWTGQTVAESTVSATKAEEYFGMRFAGQALTLDPSYQPAQVVLLSLALDKSYEKTGAALPLAVSNPAAHHLLGTVNPDLVVAVLERAISDKRFYVILGAVRALGEFAEARASRPSGHGEPVLVRALQFPDRRIQMAAAEAILRTPGTPSGQAANRVVDVLRRVVASEAAPAKSAGKVLVGYFNPLEAEQVAAAVDAAGFEAVKAKTGREVLRRLAEAADIDLLILDAALPDPGLPSLLAQLRADQNAARLPLLLTASPSREDALRRHLARYTNITVVPSGLVADAKELEIALRAKVADPTTAPLSEAEAKEYAEKAIRYFGRMARGELAGYDLRPAAGALLNAAQSSRLSQEGQIAAFEAVEGLSGGRPQTALVSAVLDPRRAPLLRTVAADLLTKHMQKHSVLLTSTQVQSLEGAFADPGVDAGLKARLAVVLGALRPDSRLTGERLRNFRLDLPAPPAGEGDKVKEDK